MHHNINVIGIPEAIAKHVSVQISDLTLISLSLCMRDVVTHPTPDSTQATVYWRPEQTE